LCSNDLSNNILPHILIETDFIQPSSTMHNCFFDETENCYELFVDESMSEVTKECAFGVWFGKNHPLNKYYKVRGNNNLQNATFQAVELALETIPSDCNINIYIDRESALKMLLKLPLTPKEQHHAHELHMLKKIHWQVNSRKGATNFKQVFSHLGDDEPSSSKSPETLEKHLNSLIEMYGENKAKRLIEGNKGADELASKGLSRKKVRAPPVNKWDNKFILKSTRVKSSTRGTFKGYVTERYRHHIKDQLRSELVYDHTNNVDRYKDWVNNPEISEASWSLVKTLDCDMEKHKNHMIKMLHNTLPTKGKIWKHLQEEKRNNKLNGTNNTFWKDKYPHIKNNRCTLCEEAEETVDHLIVCPHPFAKACYKNAHKQVAAKLGSKAIWFNCNNTGTPQELKNFSPLLGSKGIMTKHIFSKMFAGAGTPKETKDAVVNAQADIIGAHLLIWERRNKLLFGRLKKRGIT
jgi:hypothetical protein